MTIQCTFQRGSERFAIRIIGNNVLFMDLRSNMIAPIEGLKLSKIGVMKEFPDLKDDSEWKKKAIQRFVSKIRSFKTENERAEWLIQEMRNMDYIPLYKQRDGFRTRRIK